MAENPYSDQYARATAHNAPVDDLVLDANLAGIEDYGDHLDSASLFLLAEAIPVVLTLNELLSQSWVPTGRGGSWPEAELIKGDQQTAIDELQEYANNLGQGLMNVGHAARIIALSYRSTDGWSAASLDDVNFAFGVRGAPRPTGLPQGLGTTWQELESERMADGAARPAATLTGRYGYEADGANYTVESYSDGTSIRRTVRPYVDVSGASLPGLVTIVETFDNRGSLMSRTVERSAPDGKTITEKFDGQGALVTRTTQQNTHDLRPNFDNTTVVSSVERFGVRDVDGRQEYGLVEQRVETTNTSVYGPTTETTSRTATLGEDGTLGDPVVASVRTDTINPDGSHVVSTTTNPTSEDAASRDYMLGSSTPAMPAGDTTAEARADVASNGPAFDIRQEPFHE